MMEVVSQRPIRPKRVFMYSPKKEILEAICLIDDKVKYFSLDKVKLLLNDSDKTI